MTYLALCNNVADVPTPTTGDKQLIFTTDGLIYLDIQVAGTLQRLALSGVASVHTLPNVPEHNKIYIHDGVAKLYYNNAWTVLASEAAVQSIASTVNTHSETLTAVSSDISEIQGHISALQSADAELSVSLYNKSAGEEAFTANNTIRASINTINEKFETKADLVDGKVPTTQLPSFVDSVVDVYKNQETGVFYTDEAQTEELIPESGKIYVDLLTNKTYRYSGTALVEISESLAIGETADSAFAGSRGVALESSLASEIQNREDAIAAINGSTVVLTGYSAGSESDVVDVTETDTTNSVVAKLVTCLNALDTRVTTTEASLDGVLTRLEAL